MSGQVVVRGTGTLEAQPDAARLRIQARARAKDATGAQRDTAAIAQRVDAVLKLADRVAFMVGGRVEEARDVAGLTAADPVFRTYVGV